MTPHALTYEPRNTQRSSNPDAIKVFAAIILALLVVLWGLRPRYGHEPARTTIVWDDLSYFDSALESFRADCGRNPTAEEGLNALLVQPAGLASWRGPYLRGSAIPVDPWGHAYVYHIAQEGNQNPRIVCLGPDGKENTEDDTATDSQR